MADEAERPAISGKAIASLLLGLAGTGPLALLIGLSGLREVNRNEGRLRGRFLALAGMILGGIVTVAFVIGSVVLLFLYYRQKAERETCSDHLMSMGYAVRAYYD